MGPSESLVFFFASSARLVVRSFFASFLIF